MKNLGIFFLLFALAFTACRKDINDVNEETTTPDPTFLDNYVPTFIQVNADLTGFIVDENDEPVQNAQVKMGDFTTTTDQFGHFFFTNTNMNAAGTIVQVEKAGYFAGSRRFNALGDVKNRIKIELITKNFNQSFESQNGGTINLNEGGSITFDPNSIQNADGTPYTGTVKVASEWLDPSKVATLNQMPGNLFAVNNRGEEVALGTFGMIAVELESESGEPLNILKDNTAQIRMAVPFNMQSEAPTEIPLWSYNEEFGVWVEEGVATLSNGYYEGEVTHFSFWNCDIPYPTVGFTTMITDEDGNPLENYLVSVAFDTIFTGCAYTSADGVVNGQIPANESLTLSVHGLCGGVLYSQEIGPFSEDTNIGAIVVTESQLNATTVTGELVDCDGVSLQNGVVIIESNNGTVYEYVNSNTFEVIFSSCSGSDIEVTGYNLTELLQSQPINATSGIVNDLGEISVCETVEDFISLTVDGVTEIYFVNITVDTFSNFTYIQSNVQGSSFIGLGFEGVTTGNYDGQNNSLEVIFDFNNNWDFGQGESFATFDVTEYGVGGEKIVGEASGTLTNFGVTPNVAVEVDLNFSVTIPD